MTAPPAVNGLFHAASPHDVPTTIDRLQSLATERGLKVFARIDFSGDAARVGLTMPPSQLLIFGNPKAGTPIMVAAPTSAIDLPLKALAWEDRDKHVWLSYNEPSYIASRHNIPPDLAKNIAAIAALCSEAVKP